MKLSREWNVHWIFKFSWLISLYTQYYTILTTNLPGYISFQFPIGDIWASSYDSQLYCRLLPTLNDEIIYCPWLELKNETVGGLLVWLKGCLTLTKYMLKEWKKEVIIMCRVAQKCQCRSPIYKYVQDINGKCPKHL